MDVALENVGSMWLLEGKHTDPSIGFLGVGITVASPELLTHWAVFSQPHFYTSGTSGQSSQSSGRSCVLEA